MLGPAGRRDGVLFAGACFVAVLAVGGVWDCRRDGLRPNPWLPLALLHALALRRRWRATALRDRAA